MPASFRKFAAVCLTMVAVALTAAGACAQPPQPRIRITGSPLLGFLGQPAGDYGRTHGISMSVVPGRAQRGFEELRAKKAELLLVSDEFYDPKSTDLVYVLFSHVADLVWVSKDVSVDSLTLDQLGKILSGKITNWREVGGAENPIEVWRRDPDTGLERRFRRLFKVSTKFKMVDHPGLLYREFKTAKNTITYNTLTSEDRKPDLPYNAVKLDGVAPTDDNIRARKYPMTHSHYLVYLKGEPLERQVKGLIEYLSTWRTGHLAEQGMVAP